MKFKINSFKTSAKFTIAQFSTEFCDSLDYISHRKAIDENLLSIQEISESGTVNDILFINQSPYFIFLSDGDMLQGAKQNRVLNTSVFLKPHSKSIVPVSCVESGRWRYKSRNFYYDNRQIPLTMKMKKAQQVTENLRMKNSHYAEQHSIWDLVYKYSEHFREHSATSDLSEILGKIKEKDIIDIKAFTADKDSNGIALFHNLNLITVEIFNRSDIYAEYFKNIIRSVAVDFYVTKDNTDSLINSDGAERAITGLFNKISTLKIETYPGAAEGTEKRYTDKELTFYELIYDSKPVHTVIYN